MCLQSIPSRLPVIRRISTDDGLSANICRPCFWKLREFEIYKINVHQAKSELWNLKGKETDSSIKEEIEEIDVRDEQHENHSEIEGEEYECSSDVAEEELMIVKEENDASAPEVMQRRNLDHLEDECNPRTSNKINYVNSARHDEEQNVVSSHFGDGAQQEKGKCAIKSTYENRVSDSEDAEMMASKKDGKEPCNTGETEEEYNRSKELEEENEEGLSECRRIGVVTRATEKMRLISEREDGIKCHHCGDLKETKAEMVAHIQVVHGFSFREDKGPRIELTTNNCIEKMSKEDLGEYSRVCSDGKRHICNICDKRFTYNSNLKRHSKIHNEEKNLYKCYKPYKCSICSRRFVQNGGLKTHMQIHSGEKPYKCSICNSRFVQNGCLKRHILVHTGEKPYECSVCNYKCSCNANLKTHMRIHTGDKPYKCSICSSRFSQLENLKKHIRIHTGERPFKCSICNRTFNQNSSLKRHVKSHNR